MLGSAYRLRLGVLLVAAALPVASMAAPDAPLRLALPPIDRQASPTRASSFNCAMGLYLRSRFQEIPSVALISAPRQDAIMGDIVSPACAPNLGRLLASVREYQPVDAAVYYALSATGIHVVVQTENQVIVRILPLAPDQPLADGVRRTVRLISESLPLSARDLAVLAEDRLPDPEDFAAYYECQRWPVPAIAPNYRGPEYGDIRLERLFERWNLRKDSPLFAEQVFINAYELAISTRERDYFRVNWAWMAQQSLPAILGSPLEAAAYPYIRLRSAECQPTLFELCEPLSTELSGPMGLGGLTDLDAAPDAPKAGGASMDAVMDTMIAHAPEEAKPVPLTARLGALRALGFLGKPKALLVLQETAASDDARVRAAAAFGLSVYPRGEGLPRLRQMVSDKSEAVAWAAAHGLWTAGETNARLPELARKLAASDAGASSDAIQVLCAIGTDSDLPLIRSLWSRRPAGLRASLLRARIRLHDVKNPEWPSLLQDPDEAVVMEALKQPMDLRAAPALLAEIKRLANDPYGPLARAARQVILPLRPADAAGRAEFDLKFCPPYLRQKALGQLAQGADQKRLALVEAACSNRDAHTRATALGLLADRSPDRARPLVMAALDDPHRWVQFHAATLAARLADAGSSGAVEARLRAVREPAERLYLEDALARSRGLPLPASPEPARSIAGKRNLAWNTSPARHADISPFDAYYSMTTRSDAHMRRAHAAGKIIFGRATPIGQPGLIVLNSQARDEFWMQLEQELTTNSLAVLDGLVYGEETMSMTAGALWDDGWQVFCLEAGIDPARVDGRIESLTPSETRAWENWSIARGIEGFNRLHDYTKLKYGKLKPGLQICTFLPADALPHPGSPDALPAWKFDMGGVYDYKGDSRMAAYNLVRRYKTIWPDRPVLWLSLGIGGYEMNPVRHTQKVPQAPMLDRYDRAYSDALTAWMAGADTGWFSTWVFVSPTFHRAGITKLRGIQVWVEDIGPDTRLLERGIAWSFGGVEDIEAKKLEAPPPEMPDVRLDESKTAPTSEAADPDADMQAEAQTSAITQDVQVRREQFKRGFLFYQRYVYDCARIFASLPRVSVRPTALAVRGGVDVWTRPGPYPLVPGQALLTEYDFLCDVNELGLLDLDRYRYIVVHRPEALRDETIARITRWLREVPGLLVVHLDLPTGNDAEAGTVEDHDGRLANDWPWEADISRAPASGKPAAALKRVAITAPTGTVTVAQLTPAATWRLAGDRARALVTRDGSCLLALWRNAPQFRGAVLFDGVQDASAEYLAELRDVINRLHAESGVGVRLTEPASAEVFEGEHIQAVAGSHYYRAVRGEKVLDGLDIMTGDPSPEVSGPRHSKAALVANDYIGRFVAASSNVTAISDVPFTSARIDGGDLVVQSPGIIRAASRPGRVSVSTEGAKPLPEATNSVGWLLFSADEGIARFPRNAEGRVMTYVRSAAPVRLSAAAAAP